MRVERRVATVGDYPVRYKVAGEMGEPVISSTVCRDRRVGGWRMSRRWRSCIAFIWLICLDSVMRRLPLRQGVHAATNWLIRWIEAVGAQPAHVVGHSMGGQICLRLAIKRPDLVNRLALVAPAVWFVRGSLLARIAPLVDETRQFSPRFMATLSYDALRAGADHAAAFRARFAAGGRHARSNGDPGARRCSSGASMTRLCRS